MTRLRIDLAYDGTPFHGFARQREPQYTTVQGTLEGALSGFTGQYVETTCSGRTDKGVHALAQVVHVDVDTSAPGVARRLADLEKLRWVLDRQVGDAITIWRVSIVDSDFDARFSAIERGYRYRIIDALAVDPRHRTDVWHVGQPLGEPLRLRAMQIAAKAVLGEHDFSSFCRQAKFRHNMRNVSTITVARPRTGEVQVAMRGKAFCHQQVRAITGCLVEVGLGNRPPEWVGEVLAAQDRSVAGRVAPPQGLTLERVRFARPYPPSPPPNATIG